MICQIRLWHSYPSSFQLLLLLPPSHLRVILDVQPLRMRFSPRMIRSLTLHSVQGRYAHRTSLYLQRRTIRHTYSTTLLGSVYGVEGLGCAVFCRSHLRSNCFSKGPVQSLSL
ncbi:hypothetical protein BD289DRAFT_78913 [Coniella lustricola]|uniref:Uncharacterized protein n=1 Tax=Coniella lustricola TaxID=2025994 RepID=A0A2T2ZZ63_9PEZI|nr:hypothetical protein BD289DRAFT_78913 [Coniella lustricola]